MRAAKPTLACILAIVTIVAGGVGGSWVCALDGCCDNLQCVDVLCGHCAGASSLLLPAHLQILPHWSQVGLLTPEGDTASPPEPAFALYRPPRLLFA